MFCDDLNGQIQGVGGRLQRERIRVYIWLTHDIVVQQKLTQHCEAILFQFFKKALYLHCF